MYVRRYLCTCMKLMMKMYLLLQSSTQACQERSMLNVLTSAIPGVKSVSAVARYFHHQTKEWHLEHHANMPQICYHSFKKVYISMYHLAWVDQREK